MNGYKIWHCSYRKSFGFGAYEEREVIVIAEIESKALGMALMEHPKTAVAGWSAVEIPCHKEGVHYISSYET